MAEKQCNHMKQVKSVTPLTDGCQECLTTGDNWIKLRLCMSCGHVGSCDSSKNKHATKHFQSTNHPIIESYPEQDWAWCCIDKIYLDA